MTKFVLIADYRKNPTVVGTFAKKKDALAASGAPKSFQIWSTLAFATENGFAIVAEDFLGRIPELASKVHDPKTFSYHFEALSR